MRSTILSVLISVLLAFNCLANSDISEYEWIFKGYEAAIKKNLPDAIRSYNKAIETNPHSVLALYYRGLAFIESKRYQDAVDDLSKVISNQKLSVQRCVKVLEVFREEGDKGLEALCANGENKFYPVYQSLEEAEYKLNELSSTPYFTSHPKAIKSGEKLLGRLRSDLMAIAARADIAEVYFYRGVAFGRMERRKEQESDFQQAKLLGLDIDKVNPTDKRLSPRKKELSKRQTKITKEGIEYINSLNPLQRAVFTSLFTLERLKHYFTIVDRNASQAVFLNGWIKRTASVHYSSYGNILK